MQEPVAKRIEKILEIHGDRRVDPYYWLNQREDPEVLAYLNAENAYTREQLKSTEALQETLYNEIVGRIKDDDQSVPYFKNGYWYYSRYEEGKEHAIHCRKEGSLDAAEQIVLDVNVHAEPHAFYQVAGMSISPDNRFLVFGEDTLSRRLYTLRLKDLFSGEVLDMEIPNTSGGVAWANDNRHFFFTERDEQTLRTHKVHRYNHQSKELAEVFEETDETFYCYAYRSKSGDFIQIACSSTMTSENHFLSASEPLGSFTCFQERIRGMEYSMSHFEDRWYILTNWEATNFRLMQCPVQQTNREHWEERIGHREDTLLEGIEIFRRYLVVEEKRAASNHLRVIDQQEGAEYYLPFEEEARSCWTGVNPEFDSDVLRYGYSSLTTPISIYDFDMGSKAQKLMKQQEVVGGYDPSEYASERLWIEARDGTRVPVSLVYRKDQRQQSNPLLLYGYGSYGHSIDPYFSSVRLSLLDRGFIFAIAHIRGGEELGRPWYDDGKLLNKKNTFYDFIDAGKALIKEGWASEGALYAMGGSAGGLLMGAVINEAPGLWNGVIAAVPFVDVVTTMLDTSIPLTTGEYDEWGNPNEEEFYHYIKSYSPYDNIREMDYPNLLVTTGLHDSQVQYWEPAKWVARLRARRTNNALLLLHTNMETGHSGASGRFAVHKETAMEYAFLLKLAGRNS